MDSSLEFLLLWKIYLREIWFRISLPLSCFLEPGTKNPEKETQIVYAYFHLSINFICSINYHISTASNIKDYFSATTLPRANNRHTLYNLSMQINSLSGTDKWEETQNIYVQASLHITIESSETWKKTSDGTNEIGKCKLEVISISVQVTCNLIKWNKAQTFSSQLVSKHRSINMVDVYHTGKVFFFDLQFVNFIVTNFTFVYGLAGEVWFG